MEKEGNKKQQTRARIKSIGAKRFIEAGLRETMIIDIAKEVGIDRRTIWSARMWYLHGEGLLGLPWAWSLLKYKNSHRIS